MKLVFEIDFKSAKNAEKAKGVIGRGAMSRKGAKDVVTLQVVHKKGSPIITYIIESGSFAKMRARTTSLLRDVSIFLSAVEITKKEGRNE